MPELNAEKQFLHDISTPVGRALIIASILIDGMTSDSQSGQELLRRAQEILDSLKEVQEHIHKRREEIIKAL